MEAIRLKTNTKWQGVVCLVISLSHRCKGFSKALLVAAIFVLIGLAGSSLEVFAAGNGSGYNGPVTIGIDAPNSVDQGIRLKDIDAAYKTCVLFGDEKNEIKSFFSKLFYVFGSRQNLKLYSRSKLGLGIDLGIGTGNVRLEESKLAAATNANHYIFFNYLGGNEEFADARNFIFLVPSLGNSLQEIYSKFGQSWLTEVSSGSGELLAFSVQDSSGIEGRRAPAKMFIEDAIPLISYTGVAKDSGYDRLHRMVREEQRLLGVALYLKSRPGPRDIVTNNSYRFSVIDNQSLVDCLIHQIQNSQKNLE